MHKINVPVFLAGAWQDEQVGGYFATMLDRFTGTDKLHFTVVNGGHTEPLIPAIFHRWLEFLSFYVQKEIPQTPALAQTVLDVIGMIFTSPGLTLPPDRFTGATSYEEALATYEAEPQVRVLFESGAGSANPARRCRRSSTRSTPGRSPASCRRRGTSPTAARCYRSCPPATGPTRSSTTPRGSQRTTYAGGGDGIWAALPPWDWQPLPGGKALAYATAPLTDTTVHDRLGQRRPVAEGHRAGRRPAGNPERDPPRRPGDLRAERLAARQPPRARRDAVERAATGVDGTRGGRAALPAEQFVLARVELFPFAHAFRAGSRIRISVEAPGGDRPLWKFEALPAEGEVIVDVARSAAYPSRVVLPVVPGVDVPTTLPPCPSLRGEPCRTYVELDNSPS